MPVYRVRLEAQDDSGHYRRSDIDAPDPDTACEWLMEREYRKAAYQLDPSPQVAEELKRTLEDRLGNGTITPHEKARLFTHRQAEPYKIVSVQKIKDGPVSDQQRRKRWFRGR